MGNFQKDQTGWGLVIFGDYVAPLWARTREKLISRAVMTYVETWRKMKRGKFKAKAVRMKLCRTEE